MPSHKFHVGESVTVTPEPARIMRAAADAPVDAPLMWTLAFGHHEDRTPTHGYAMAAFVKSWRRK
jgi:hypothetical protein